MRVLVPVDGSDHSEWALDHAIDQYGSDEIVLLNVLDLVEAGYESSAGGELPGYWSNWHEQAEENDVDTIVIGSHGREGVSRILLGSVAETVVRRSPVPVTVVR